MNFINYQNQNQNQCPHYVYLMKIDIRDNNDITDSFLKLGYAGDKIPTYEVKTKQIRARLTTHSGGNFGESIIDINLKAVLHTPYAGIKEKEILDETEAYLRPIGNGVRKHREYRTMEGLIDAEQWFEDNGGELFDDSEHYYEDPRIKELSDEDTDSDESYNESEYTPYQYNMDVSNDDSNQYPLESYGTYMSHRSLQGAPTESSENLTKGQISLRIRKDNMDVIDHDYNPDIDNMYEPSNGELSEDDSDDDMIYIPRNQSQRHRTRGFNV